MKNLYFGFVWGLAVDDPSVMTATPVGEKCLHCEESIAPGDAGLLLHHVSCRDGKSEVRVRAQHRECFLRTIVGSVGHQLKRCPCYGGQDDDPVNLSRREAARAAVELAGVNARRW